MRLTIIHTLEPITNKYVARPACELYRTLEQTANNVFRREYEKGIPTWIATHRVHDSWMQSIDAVGRFF